MTITREETLRDIVSADFRAAGVFHRHGINFCCDGGRTLAEACCERRVDEQEVLEELERACARPDSRTPRFSDWETETLIAYIVGHHHSYVRRALSAIATHTQKIASVHGANHPELREVADIFEGVVIEMTSHMAKEENILFPYIAAVADAVRTGDEMPDAPFGRIDNPIRMMESEHEAAGAALARIRSLSRDYTPPDDACTTYRVCLQELSAFEEDLRKHVHLENNLLFPRARVLAARAGR